MRSALLLGFAIGCLSVATPLLARAQSVGGPRVRDLAREASTARLRRRALDKTINLIIDNTGTAYQLNVTVGTPGQQQSLLLGFDDGTSWVNAANATFCNSSPCTSVYNVNQSSSANPVSDGFQISYSDGTTESGVWFNDTVGLSQDTNDYQISDVQLGLAYSTGLASGILGLGYNSTSTDLVNQRNLPYQIYKQGYTDCICYSLWLNEASASHGRLIFGGVDTGKFQGNLATLPLHLDTYPTISLAGVQTSQGNINTQITNVPLDILPDAGTTLIYLPTNVTQLIYNQVNATYDKNQGVAVIDCQAQKSSTSIGFTFAITNTTSTTISVPMSELVSSLSTDSCYIAIAPSDQIAILGVAFFRNAYIIYDYTQQQVSVAPANFFSTSDNVTAIGAGGVDASIDTGTGPLSFSTSAISTSTAVASTSTQSATSTPASASASTSASPSATSQGLTTGAKAGIGIGVTLGAILVLAVVGFSLLRRHRGQRKAHTAAATEDTRHEKPELDAEGVQLKRASDPFYEADAAATTGRHELKSGGEYTRHEMRSNGEHTRHELPSAQDARHELSSDPMN